MWNWKDKNWPNFQWDSSKLRPFEQQFLENAGMNVGGAVHLPTKQVQDLGVELMLSEAMSTSEIEGELLNRDSVQNSLKRAMGLKAQRIKSTPAEFGIAEMMVDVKAIQPMPLTEAHLFRWHEMLLNGRRDIEVIGAYRQHPEAMQIVSGPDYNRTIHFEAPPSGRVAKEMQRFFQWYLQTAANQPDALPALTRAGISHLWFESVHPFEDGNGRIGRAIAEKILAEGVSKPTPLTLAKVMLKYRKQYYQALSQASQSLDITEWLLWFAKVVIEAQLYTQSIIVFIIEKTQLLDRLKGQLNARQEKVLLRMLEQGPEGFEGGLSAKNYMSIAGSTVPTTTRDLTDLVKKDALIKKGERKATRYYLNLKTPSLP